MKYVLLAALLLIVGIALTRLDRDEQAYTPVVRVRTDSGLFVTIVQAVTPEKAACSEAVKALVSEINSTCPVCYVESRECSTKLAGMDHALAAGEALPVYTIAGDGIRIAMLGPPNRVASQCTRMAAVMGNNGLRGAVCVSPQFGQNEVARVENGKPLE